ncbi:MAG: hypothetical protein AAF433_08815 [Bacteroidota bacterium]
MLKANFISLAACASFPELALELWEEIAVEYGAKKRAYHNLDHLRQMLDGLDTWTGQAVQDAEILGFSIFYHDLIYQVPGRNNEARSAQRAVEVLEELGLAEDRITRCHDQILATKTHELNRQDDPDQAILLDLDLAILGSKREDYQNYTKRIRREYRIIPGPLYRSGRRRVLHSLLDVPRLFHTEHYRERYESIARDNLQWELTQL